MAALVALVALLLMTERNSAAVPKANVQSTLADVHPSKQWNSLRKEYPRWFEFPPYDVLQRLEDGYLKKEIRTRHESARKKIRTVQAKLSSGNGPFAVGGCSIEEVFNHWAGRHASLERVMEVFDTCWRKDYKSLAICFQRGRELGICQPSSDGRQQFSSKVLEELVQHGRFTIIACLLCCISSWWATYRSVNPPFSSGLTKQALRFIEHVGVVFEPDLQVMIDNCAPHPRQQHVLDLKLGWGNGIYVCPIAKNGDCFFACMATVFGTDVTVLREHVSTAVTPDTLQTYRTVRKVKCVPDNALETVETLQAFMLTSEYWADEFAIKVVLRYFPGVQICVASKQMDKTRFSRLPDMIPGSQSFIERHSEFVIALLFSNDAHYDLLTQESGKNIWRFDDPVIKTLWASEVVPLPVRASGRKRGPPEGNALAPKLPRRSNRFHPQPPTNEVLERGMPAFTNTNMKNICASDLISQDVELWPFFLENGFVTTTLPDEDSKYLDGINVVQAIQEPFCLLLWSLRELGAWLVREQGRE